jgi:hypothetical protein
MEGGMLEAGGPLKFDDYTVRRIFGSEDAESEEPERLKQYFLVNGAYNDLRSPLPLRIVVGHKGVGKSALLKRAYLDDVEKNILAVEIKPNDISELMISPATESFIQKIERWKNGIRRIVAEKAVSSLLHDGYDAVAGAKVKGIGLSTTKFIRQVIEYLKPNINDAINIAVADSFLKSGLIRVYIDDVDRGWSASQSDISNISALINAVRDLCNADRSFQCRIALRTDVYFLVRTSDESTDKIEQDIIRLQWSNDDILRMISLRIITYFDLPLLNDLSTLSQARISREILSRVMNPTFSGRGLWQDVPVSVPLMSLCRKRPRDLVKLLHGAARTAGHENRNCITTEDLEKSFEIYSDERLQDLVNEFKSELPEIRSVLLKFKPSKKQKQTSINYRYTTDQMVEKIKNIRQQVRIRFASGTPVSELSILGFLYKIDFIIARLESDGRGKFTYFDQRRFLANDAIDFGYQWEIHPAYRWAIQPNDIQDIIDSLPDLSK